MSRVLIASSCFHWRHWLRLLLLSALATLAACGGGGDANPAPPTPPETYLVSYGQGVLMVNGRSFTGDSTAFMGNRGHVYVFEMADAAAQAELTRFVGLLGLKVTRFVDTGRQPTSFSKAAEIEVPVGYETHWVQALVALRPGLSALAFLPCC
ncbi:MAG: hypothetical protein U1E77_16745 [Inhella sp.]